MTTAVGFPALLERYFTERLLRQRKASPHTIASYCVFHAKLDTCSRASWTPEIARRFAG